MSQAPTPLDSFETESNRMVRYCDELLVLVSLMNRRPNPETTSVHELARDVWSQLNLPPSGIAIGEVPIERVDRQWTAELFSALFRNVIDHGSANPRLRIGGLSNGRGFHVSDNGPGIPRDRRELVFKSGYTTLNAGSGFGLSIVRHVARAHGWEVTLSENDQGGARFEFREM